MTKVYATTPIPTPIGQHETAWLFEDRMGAISTHAMCLREMHFAVILVHSCSMRESAVLDRIKEDVTAATVRIRTAPSHYNRPQCKFHGLLA